MKVMRMALEPLVSRMRETRSHALWYRVSRFDDMTAAKLLLGRACVQRGVLGRAGRHEISPCHSEWRRIINYDLFLTGMFQLILLVGTAERGISSHTIHCRFFPAFFAQRFCFVSFWSDLVLRDLSRFPSDDDARRCAGRSVSFTSHCRAGDRQVASSLSSTTTGVPARAFPEHMNMFSCHVSSGVGPSVCVCVFSFSKHCGRGGQPVDANLQSLQKCASILVAVYQHCFFHLVFKIHSGGYK